MMWLYQDLPTVGLQPKPSSCGSSRVAISCHHQWSWSSWHSNLGGPGDNHHGGAGAWCWPADRLRWGQIHAHDNKEPTSNTASRRLDHTGLLGSSCRCRPLVLSRWRCCRNEKQMLWGSHPTLLFWVDNADLCGSLHFGVKSTHEYVALGGFQSHGGTPKSSNLDHFGIETHGFWDPPFRESST